MTHLDPAKKTSPSELRKFGLLVGSAFLVLAAIAFWRHKPAAVPDTFAVVGGLLVSVGAIAPQALGSTYSAWMRFAVALSKITTPIFMGIVYFVILTPIGLIMRALGKNPLAAARTDSSTWVTRPIGERASSLERQF